MPCMCVRWSLAAGFVAPMVPVSCIVNLLLD
jgi:hypothetical protein